MRAAGTVEEREERYGIDKAQGCTSSVPSDEGYVSNEGSRYGRCSTRREVFLLTNRRNHITSLMLYTT